MQAILAILTRITLSILALAYPGAHPSAYPANDTARAEAAALDCVAAAKRFPGLSEERRTALTKISFAFSAFEGNWNTDPKGDNDKKRACGVMQTHNPQWFVEGATCARVRSDRVLAYQVGMTIILQKWKACGSLEAGLTAYGTEGGSCKNFVLPLVKRRCKIAEVDCSEKF